MKRLFDIVASVAILTIFSLPLLVLVGLVRIKLGRPVFFTQVRPGLGGKLFKLIKFRTMTDARGPTGELLPDADRLTPFGRMLRSTSLDELPELWNVIKGEMSLVGPRPLLVRTGYLVRGQPKYLAGSQDPLAYAAQSRGSRGN